MAKTKRKRIGDIGIRLKPIEKNLLENYNEFFIKKKKSRKKKKKKSRKKRIKKPKIITKKVEIHNKVDPLFKIMEENKNKEIKIKELSEKEENINNYDKEEKVKEKE